MQTTARHWQTLGGVRDYHGIVSPLSAIRTHQSLGIGDFDDLRVMIDWLAATGFRVLQLLPIHDTGYESSPYLAISSFSINPVYISLRDAPLLPFGAVCTKDAGGSVSFALQLAAKNEITNFTTVD